MVEVVSKKTKQTLKYVPFISLSVDKVTTIDS